MGSRFVGEAEVYTRATVEFNWLLLLVCKKLFFIYSKAPLAWLMLDLISSGLTLLSTCFALLSGLRNMPEL